MLLANCIRCIFFTKFLWICNTIKWFSFNWLVVDLKQVSLCSFQWAKDLFLIAFVVCIISNNYDKITTSESSKISLSIVIAVVLIITAKTFNGDLFEWSSIFLFLYHWLEHFGLCNKSCNKFVQTFALCLQWYYHKYWNKSVCIFLKRWQKMKW